MADQPNHESTAPARSRLRRTVPYLYLMVIAFALSAVHVARYQALSPIDELRHVDYTMRVTELDLVKLGDKIGQESMREEACRGVDLAGWEDPPCHSRHFKPVQFRDNGYQTASLHPLTYYVGVGLVARALVGVGLFDSFVDPARLMGGLLLGAGLALTFAAGRRLGIRHAPLLAALTLVPTCSAVLHASSTVNPDASSFLAGGIVLLAAVAWEQGRFRTPFLFIAGLAATGLKSSNLLAVLVVASWLAVRSPTADRLIAHTRAKWGRADPADPPLPTTATSVRRDPFVRAAAFLTAGGTAAVVAWALFDRLRATIPLSLVPQNQGNALHGLPPWGFTFLPGNVFSWFPPIDGYDPFTSDPTNITNGNVRMMVLFLFAGAMLMACLRVARRDSMCMLGTTGTIVGLAAGPAFVVLTAVVSKVRIGAGGRYGLSLLPIFVIVLASSVRGRVGTLLFSSFAIVAYGAIFVTVVVATAPNPVVH